MTSKEKATKIAKLLSAKLADSIRIVDISTASDIADYFVICSAKSVPQAKALFEHIEAEMEADGFFSLRKEGASEGRWVAIDYGDVIVHIFHRDARDLYALDILWNSGDNVVSVD